MERKKKISPSVAWTNKPGLIKPSGKRRKGFLHVASSLSVEENRAQGTQRMLRAGVSAKLSPGELSQVHQEALSQVTKRTQLGTAV